MEKSIPQTGFYDKRGEKALHLCTEGFAPVLLPESPEPLGLMASAASISIHKFLQNHLSVSFLQKVKSMIDRSSQKREQPFIDFVMLIKKGPPVQLCI